MITGIVQLYVTALALKFVVLVLSGMEEMLIVEIAAVQVVVEGHLDL